MKTSNVTKIHVLLSSPGDTKSEKEYIEKYIESYFNKNIAQNITPGLIVEVTSIEKHFAVINHSGIQERIDKELLESSDILIGIFWMRFDLLTANKESGTIEEIDYFLRKGKPVIMYFLDKPIPPSLAGKQTFDLLRIEKFKEDYKDSNIYKVVSNETDLKEYLDTDLENRVRKILGGDVLNDTELKLTSLKVEDNDKLSEVILSQEQPWYEKSITDIIQKELNETLENFPKISYNRNLSHDENLEFWRDKVPVDVYSSYRDAANIARELAFTIKYGNYDYKDDLRSKYTGVWQRPILDTINQSIPNLDSKHVLSVASNYGLEIEEIFGIENNLNIDVLELCKVSIKKGKSIYNNVTFVRGNMEDIRIMNSANKYDLYLNLRSIHSRGVSKHKTLLECHRVLKPGGLAIISISNGYLTPSEDNNIIVEKIGMYDHSRAFFSREYPWELANEIRKSLQKYDFINVGLRSDSATEIIVYGTKR